MDALSKALSKFMLSPILARACENRIPRTGEAGAQVNCFVTAVDKDGEPYLIVLGISDDQLECIEFDGNTYNIQKTLSLDEFKLSSFKITHYYGLDQVNYMGLVDFAINRATGWPYIKILSFNALNRFDQYLFNKKKLVTNKRTDLLKVLLGKTLDGSNEIDVIDLMTDLYSIKWLMHPNGESEQQKLEFYLDSLVDTGELQKSGVHYFITGHALRAIEDQEEQERKHTESVKMQWRMFWLALAVAALTIVQAGLIKLPPLIDLDSRSPAKSSAASTPPGRHE